MNIERHPRRSDAVIAELDAFTMNYDAELLAIRSLSATAVKYRLRSEDDMADIYFAEAESRKKALPN